jgi:hypothetical protein
MERMAKDDSKKSVSRLASLIADFCNKIGTFETSADVRYTAAFEGNPDIELTSPQGRVCEGFRMPAAHERCRGLRRPASENLQGRKPRDMEGAGVRRAL